MMNTDDKIAAERYILQGHARHGPSKPKSQELLLNTLEFAGGNLDSQPKSNLPLYLEDIPHQSAALQKSTGVSTSAAVGNAFGGLGNILDWDHSLDATREELRKLKAPMLDTHHPDLVAPWYRDHYESWYQWALDMEAQRLLLEADAKAKEKVKTIKNWSSIYGRAPSHRAT
jgi:hypothetical protein